MAQIQIDLASRALFKFRRAGALFHGLEQAIQVWNDEHQLRAPVRIPRDGAPAVEFFRPENLGEEIPWDDWEATFHDGVHNLRVALDSLCFELCHLEGQQPARPGSIHFPITSNPNEWPNWTQQLSTVPAELLDRLRDCQPWARPDPLPGLSREPDPLQLISRVDNVDKHRAAGVMFEVLPWPQWDRPSAPLPERLARAHDWPLDHWVRLEVAEELPYRGIANLQPVYVLPMVFFERLQAIVPDAQRWLCSETKRIIDFIATGHWPAAGFERVFSGPTWSPADMQLVAENVAAPEDSTNDDGRGGDHQQ